MEIPEEIENKYKHANVKTNAFQNEDEIQIWEKLRIINHVSENYRILKIKKNYD